MAALNRRGGAVPANNGAVVAAAHGGDGGAGGAGRGVYWGAVNNGAVVAPAHGGDGGAGRGVYRGAVNNGALERPRYRRCWKEWRCLSGWRTNNSETTHPAPCLQGKGTAPCESCSAKQEGKLVCLILISLPSL